LLLPLLPWRIGSRLGERPYADLVVVVQTIGAGLVGASTSAFFEEDSVAVSYEQAGNIMISGLALQVSLVRCPIPHPGYDHETGQD
jgi:hypothetical protein